MSYRQDLANEPSVWGIGMIALFGGVISGFVSGDWVVLIPIFMALGVFALLRR